MKIGFIVDCINKEKAGIGVYAQGIIEAFTKYSKNCVGYYIDNKKNANFQKNITIPNPLPFGKKIIWYNYLPFALQKNSYDFIWNFYSVPHIVPFPQKEVVFVYDLSTVLFPQYHNTRSFLIYKLLYKRTLQRAHTIVAISEQTKKDLMRHYNIPEHKIFTLYIPHVISKKSSPVTVKKPYMLNVNTIEPRKNIISLVKAFEYLKDTYSIPHNLVIVGNLGWRYKSTMTEIERSKYSQDIIVTGYLSESEKNYLYTHASVFVYPSFYEGLGIPVYEALDNKCPVVCSNIPMTKEYLKNCTVTINPHDHISIGKGIYKILRSDNLKMKLIQQGSKEVRKLRNSASVANKIRSFEHFLLRDEKYL
jgi:glycosyltransferase involved in cell wall biosynthesis